MIIIKKERWGKKKDVVAVRDDGNLVSWASAKKMSLQRARDTFKLRGTLSSEYVYKQHHFNTGVRESSKVYPLSDKLPERPERKKGFISAQFAVGTYDVGGEKGIWGRSNRIKGNTPMAIKRAVNKARERFYKLLDRHFTGRYDEDEGMELAVQNNIKVQHGFVWYERDYRRIYPRE
jgi:hypothetical protein